MIQRKNYFIKKKFQVNFISKFITLIIVEAILIAGLFIYITRDTLTTGYFNSTLTVERTPSFFLIPVLLVMLMVAVGVGIAGMVIFILLSHRIAGPLYRFEKDLEEICSGNLTKRINLRKTDQLAELKESLNAVVGSLDHRMSRLKSITAELKGLLSQEINPANAEKIYGAVERLKNEIDHFKVTSGPNE